jgi:hypothetical protein
MAGGGLRLLALVGLAGPDDVGERGDSGAADSSGLIAAIAASKSTVVLTGTPPLLEAGGGGLGDVPGVRTADTDDGGLPDVEIADPGEAARFVRDAEMAWAGDHADGLAAAEDGGFGEEEKSKEGDSTSTRGEVRGPESVEFSSWSFARTIAASSKTGGMATSTASWGALQRTISVHWQGRGRGRRKQVVRISTTHSTNVFGHIRHHAGFTSMSLHVTLGPKRAGGKPTNSPRKARRLDQHRPSDS